MSYAVLLGEILKEEEQFKSGRRSLDSLVKQVEAVVSNYPEEPEVPELDRVAGELEIINAIILDPRSGKKLLDFEDEIDELLNALKKTILATRV